MGLLFIEVKNWGAFQDRDDRPNYSWFKFANNFWEDPKMRQVSFAARVSFAYILCERSKNAKLYAEIDTRTMAFHLETTEEEIFKRIEELESMKPSPVICRHHADSLPSSRRLDKRRLDKRRVDKKGERKSAPKKQNGAAVIPQLKPLESVLIQKRIAEATQTAWLEAYPDAPWVIGEVRKAVAWETADPKNHRPRFGMFLTNWLGRGWENRTPQRTQPKLITTEAEAREAGLL